MSILALSAFSAGIFKILADKEREEEYGSQQFTGIINLGKFDDTTQELISGYNYVLLKRFAKDFNSSIDIREGKQGQDWIDSLRNDVIDILVVPADTCIVMDSLSSSMPVDGLARWYVKTGRTRKIEEINTWIEKYHSSEDYLPLRNSFLKTYNPIISAKAGVKRSALSPYDSLIRKYADTLGWDWKLLAAVIYQESRFRINAHSYKGAEGLMQMIRTTADRYKIDNLFDPEESIKGGAMHLSRLQNMFWRYAATPHDRRLFALAGYNAGEGHIKKCIKYADSLGVQVTTWEELKSYMPLFDFKWGETLTYISRIDSCYQAFTAIYQPEPNKEPSSEMITQNGQSGPDPLGK